MIKYWCLMLAAIGSLYAAPSEGIPKKGLEEPSRPKGGNIYMGCRSTDVNWENFPRFEWCVDYFVSHPKDALNNPNFVAKAGEWMEFIKKNVIAQVKKDKTLSEEVKKNEENDAQSDDAEDMPKVKFMPISEIKVGDTMLRAQNMIAGTVEVLEKFQAAAKQDKSLLDKVGKATMAGIAGTIKLGNNLCEAVGSMAQVAMPKNMRAPNFAAGLNVLFNLIK